MSEAIGQLVQTLETQSSVPVGKGKGQLSNAMVQIASGGCRSPLARVSAVMPLLSRQPAQDRLKVGLSFGL